MSKSSEQVSVAKYEQKARQTTTQDNSRAKNRFKRNEHVTWVDRKRLVAALVV